MADLRCGTTLVAPVHAARLARPPHRRAAMLVLATSSMLLASRVLGGRAHQSPGFEIVPALRDPTAVRKTFTDAQLVILEKLNRRDVEHLTRADPPVPGWIVPTVWPAADDVIALSPLPDVLEWADDDRKFLVVHQPWQVFGAYEHGRLVRWGPVSTGRRETRTPSGLFHLTWRSRGRHSTDNAAWFLPWYFNFHNERGVSFHQFDLPGYPASHACVRLLERDAQWLFEWGEGWTLDDTQRRILQPGTPVFIVGQYEYGSPPPWVNLGALAGRLTIERPASR